MSVIIACPSCGGKLRLSDDLRGQPVRCPVCDHTFDAAPPADPPPLDPLDLPLQLSLDEPSSEPRPAPAGNAPGLVGAIEMKSSPEDEQPPSPPPRPQPSRRTPPRLSEDQDLPDLRRRGSRLDAEPDRGATVLTLGIISVVCISLCGPIGLILGLISWVMGQKDLGKMKRGDMDSKGQGMTQAGWICGIIGTILNGLWTLACLGYFGLIFVLIQHTTPPTTRPAIAPAPAPQWPPPNPKPPRRRF